MLPNPVRLRSLALAAVLLLPLSAPVAGQDPPLPMTEAVVQGELDNGLRYYVQQNSRPENRAELRLVVNVGSVLEEDGQQGLAHLLEHMAFNGTASFEKQELVDYLESIGMAFGPSINAYTSFDETVYILRVPTDDAEMLSTGFQILEEWAHQITLDPAEVDAERGVVIEEWRLGRGAGARIQDQQLPVVFSGSRYADRLPIGDPEILESFPQEEIERFYADWYRPDLMAVVAVGDFDPAEIESLIRDRFGRIPAPTTPLERPYFHVPDHTDTYFSLVTDPEMPQGQIVVLSMQEPAPTTTVAELRESIIDQLVNGMLNTRLQELAQEADPPFLGAGTSRGSFVRTSRLWQMGAGVTETGHERAFEALLTEMERAARHGFTEGELAREKADLLRAWERQYDERENQPSAALASRYVNHFLTGEVVLSPELGYQAAQGLVPTITLDDVTRVAEANLASTNRVVLAAGPEKEGVELPTQEALENTLARVAAAEIEPYVDDVVAEALVAEPPTPGSIVEEIYIESVDLTGWTLSNGARVWLKPTDYKDDEVVFRATSPGGYSLADESEAVLATNATAFVTQGGVGEFSAIDLQKVLAGRSASVSPSIAETREVLSGQASRKDLDALFELIWLRFTAPRVDDNAVAALKQQFGAVLSNRGASPQANLIDTLTTTLSSGSVWSATPTVEEIEALQIEEMVSFYRERFADGGDFDFVFVGAFELDEMRPWVEQWLAALPDVEGEESWRDLGIDPPEGRVEKTVLKGVEPQSQTVMVFTGDFEYTALNRLRIRSMAEILQVRLRETLREELGGTYSVGVNASYEKVPDETFSIAIQFGADPERAEELRAAVFAEIERLQTEGPTDLDVQKAVEGERRGNETSRESNGWWASQLRYAIESGEDPAFLVDDGRLDEITVENVQADARLYLGTENLVIVTLLPERPVG